MLYVLIDIEMDHCEPVIYGTKVILASYDVKVLEAHVEQEKAIACESTKKIHEYRVKFSEKIQEEVKDFNYDEWKEYKDKHNVTNSCTPISLVEIMSNYGSIYWFKHPEFNPPKQYPYKEYQIIEIDESLIPRGDVK